MCCCCLRQVPYAATNMEGLVNYYEHLRDYLAAELPYFGRRGGADLD